MTATAPELHVEGGPPTKRASALGYWLGALILTAGTVVAVVWFVVTIVDVVTAPDDFERVDIPGRATVDLDEGDWMLYLEVPGISDETRFRVPDVEITDERGRRIEISDSGSQTYMYGGHEGAAFGEFSVGGGTYRVEVLGEPSRFGRSAELAIGRPLFGGTLVAGILGPLALGLATWAVGVTLLVVTAVRRRPARSTGS